MKTRCYNAFLLVLLALLLANCGGEPVSQDNDNSGGGGGGGGSGSGDGVSYLPLLVYEPESDFSGFSQPIFRTVWQDEFVPHYLINPVNSSTLAPLSNVTAANYKVTVDGIDIDPLESFPLLQRVIGTDVFLRTALVFDVSGSTDAVNFTALINEARAYITAAQSHSNALISNQEFMIWAFGADVENITGTFTSDPTALNNALDAVATFKTNGNLGLSSNINRAIVETIGRYAEAPYDFSVGDNDLFDLAIPDGVLLSQLVIFSSGPDTFLEMDTELMESAIGSQAFVQYTAAGAAGTVNLYKPVFYYVTGGASPGVPYGQLASNSEETTFLTLSGGAYSFSAGLIQDQLAAVAARVNLTNQYAFRFKFIPRVGDHTIVFTGADNELAYSLTTDVEEAFLTDNTQTPGLPLASLVEITGVNGEYISQNTIDFSEAQTFAPATRWTNLSYGTPDYTWNLAGGTGTANPNGTYTVNTIAGATAVLTLTNTIRAETAQIIVVNQ